MSTLLSIESNFLRLPAISDAFRLADVRTLQRTILNSKKKKFETSVALSKHVAAAFAAFKSAEIQAAMSEEGISWNAEAFALKVFGWQKSFFYKVVKVAAIPDEVIEQYSAKCDSEGDDAARSVEELLKFTRSVAAGNEGSGQDDEGSGQEAARPSVLLSLKYKCVDGEDIKLKILDNGEVSGNCSSAQLASIVHILSTISI